MLDVSVRNLTGHKLPTGYPARRSWLHVTVRDQGGRMVFESGAVQASGAIAGNDNDADATRYEPHYEEIRTADQVQIYESMMVDGAGAVTTGLLAGHAVREGQSAAASWIRQVHSGPDIAVRGDAAKDPDFNADGDRVRYRIATRPHQPAAEVEVALRYQPISFRWARTSSLRRGRSRADSSSYFDSMSDQSSVVVRDTCPSGPR